jgi:hypothetical protein
MPTTLRQQRANARKAAMPEVKRLVKKYGRATISNCVNQLRNIEREQKKIAALKRQIAEMSRRVR